MNITFFKIIFNFIKILKIKLLGFFKTQLGNKGTFLIFLITDALSKLFFIARDIQAVILNLKSQTCLITDISPNLDIPLLVGNQAAADKR